MSTQTRKPALYQRHPELKLSPDQLEQCNRRLRETLQKFVDEGNEAEQQETGAFLMDARVQTRESNRPENRQ